MVLGVGQGPRLGLMLGFFTSKAGLALVVALVVLVALAWVYLEGKQAGAATAAALATAEAARRAAAARRARANVDLSQEAEDNDPYNRRNRRPR